jgi:HSP20 family protein
MALIRWDPFRDLLSLQDRMDRLFEENVTRNNAFEEALTTGIWSPVVDIYETDEKVIIKVELPGMTKSDVVIEINGNNLVLRGERKFQKDIREENYHCIERSYGMFSRSFALPDTVDRDNVVANFVEGILEITIPKVEGAKPRQIEIKGE